MLSPILFHGMVFVITFKKTNHTLQHPEKGEGTLNIFWFIGNSSNLRFFEKAVLLVFLRLSSSGAQAKRINAMRQRRKGFSWIKIAASSRLVLSDAIGSPLYGCRVFVVN